VVPSSKWITLRILLIGILPVAFGATGYGQVCSTRLQVTSEKEVNVTSGLQFEEKLLSDLDGDHQEDTVSTESRNGETTINVRLSSFPQPITLENTSPIPIEGLLVCDVNRDNLNDIVVLSFGSPFASIWINEGKGTFRKDSPFNLSENLKDQFSGSSPVCRRSGTTSQNFNSENSVKTRPTRLPSQALADLDGFLICFRLAILADCLIPRSPPSYTYSLFS
jgi:hypothetical protein